MTFDVVTIGSSTQDVFLIQKDVQIITSKKFATGKAECLAMGAKVELDGVVFDTGGGATNAAVTLRRAGLRVGIFSRIGKDPAGHEVLRVLKNEKIDVRHIVTDKDHGTAYSSILLTPEGERTILVYRGAASHFEWEEFPIRKIKTRWLYVTSVAGNKQFFDYLIQWSKLNGVRIMWNPGAMELEWGWETIEEYGKDVEVLNINRDEAATLTKKLLDNIQGIHDTLRRSRFPIILVTDGPRGAMAWLENGERYSVEATAHKAINTTGAGDAFGSAFLAGYIKFKKDVPLALRLAAHNSGGVVAEMGPKHGIMRHIPGSKILRSIVVTKE